MKRHDLTGKTFGRWTVAGPAASRITPGGSGKAYWHCVCACGSKEEVRTEHLRSGRSESCGCLKSEAAAIQKHVHGSSKSLLYGVWIQMLQRCENPKSKSFHRYGGRGISVCARWHDFCNFQADNVAEYEPGLTIDRRDNDGNYEPGNVRWVPNQVNCRNTSRTLHVEWEGQRVPLNDLADRYGIKKNTLYARVKVRGVPLAEALGVPA